MERQAGTTRPCARLLDELAGRVAADVRRLATTRPLPVRVESAPDLRGGTRRAALLATFLDHCERGARRSTVRAVRAANTNQTTNAAPKPPSAP